MSVFFADLDGTVIRSALPKRRGDVAVEYNKDGAESTCIPAKSMELLSALDFIPVTTRSIEQYRRIRFPDGYAPRYALVSNGGNLLINGVPQPNHAEWAAGITRECEEELSACRGILESDPFRSFEIRMVDGLFLFTKSGDPLKTARRLDGTLSGCEFFNTGAKVYVIPKRLNKGNGALRLLERAGELSGKIICAGDSEMDISLLNIADIALFPDDLPRGSVVCETRLSHGREGFCEFVAETAWRMSDK